MKMKAAYLILALLCLLSHASAQDSASGPDVQARLVLADQKAIYRIGEPITFFLELTAGKEGYSADSTPDGANPISDAISISPEAGVNYWLNEYPGGGRGFRDHFTIAKLTTTPLRIPIQLNDSIRIDRPGRYSVKVTTGRVRPQSDGHTHEPALKLTTNEVSFEVQSMSEADEEKEIKRLSELFDSARSWQAQEQIGREIAYLTGDVAAREKVRRFLNADGKSGNYYHQIHNGLFIARNRALVLQLLETTMRDPKTPVSSGMLAVVTRLRSLRQRAGSPVSRPYVQGVLTHNADPELTTIKDDYVTELAAGLDKRSGDAQTRTAMTILTNLPKDPQTSAALLSEVRRILLAQFDTLHPFDQEYLTRVYWEQLRDPSLVPSLKKMLSSSSGVASKNIHDSALKRLLEIAPDEARPYVISEIRDPTSLVALEILSSLPDKSLPEVDYSLLEQIRRFVSSKISFDRTYLKQKASLTARYATKSIYADVMDIYRNAGDKLPMETRPGFLAYFARHNEEEALPLIHSALRGLPPGQDFNLLPDLTRLYFSEAIDALLRERLQSDEPQTAGTAAYLISLHGAASDQKVLEERLRRWRSDWRDRSAEAETNSQGTVERELILGLTRAKSWKLSSERVRELEQSCLTQICRMNFRVQ
jgi:hypothetical protein